MKTIKKIVIFILALCIILGAVGAVYYFTRPVDVDDASGGKNHTITTREIVSRLEEIGELATYQGSYTATKTDSTALIDWDISPNFNFHLGKNEITMTGTEIVKVGYDIEMINAYVDDSVIHIELPEPEVLDNYLVLDSVVIDEKNNILNWISAEQYLALQLDMQEDALARAEEKGIYAKAESHMRSIIRNFLAMYDGYSVVFD